MLQNLVQSRLLKVLWIPARTATKRASGGNKATNNTAGRRLGPKKGEGEPVTAGQIIFRQRGTVWYPGENAGIGRDHTIFAKEPGFVRFYRDPFHPKRKFIGIALAAQDRLPTPHFEPRRRRFGFTAIDEPEISEFEESFFKKKEVERAHRTDASFSAREQARAKRFEEFSKKVEELAPGVNVEATAARLMQIYQYMRGGSTFAEAATIVDTHQLDDIAIDLKTGRISQQEFDDLSSAYKNVASTSDAQIMLGPRLDLCPYKSEQQLQELHQQIFDQLKALEQPIQPEIGTPQEVITKVLEILAAPELSEKDIHKLKSVFIRRPVPVLSSKGSFDKQVKSGNGKLMTVWNKEKGKMQQYFVPKNAVMVFN